MMRTPCLVFLLAATSCAVAPALRAQQPPPAPPARMIVYPEFEDDVAALVAAVPDFTRERVEAYLRRPPGGRSLYADTSQANALADVNRLENDPRHAPPLARTMRRHLLDPGMDRETRVAALLRLTRVGRLSPAADRIARESFTIIAGRASDPMKEDVATAARRYDLASRKISLDGLWKVDLPDGAGMMLLEIAGGDFRGGVVTKGGEVLATFAGDIAVEAAMVRWQYDMTRSTPPPDPATFQNPDINQLEDVGPTHFVVLERNRQTTRYERTSRTAVARPYERLARQWSAAPARPPPP